MPISSDLEVCHGLYGGWPLISTAGRGHSGHLNPMKLVPEKMAVLPLLTYYTSDTRAVRFTLWNCY